MPELTGSQKSRSSLGRLFLLATEITEDTEKTHCYNNDVYIPE